MAPCAMACHHEPRPVVPTTGLNLVMCYTQPMSAYEIRQLHPTEFPPLLAEIPQPPTTLWCAGTLPPPEMPLLAVVGSRQYTSYGATVVKHLIKGLAGYPIGIVSGLALGIDSLAHEAALENRLYTLAIPGSGLSREVLYPARHRALAENIVATGGGLLSEYPPEHHAAKWTFIARNRLMAGMCHATLLIEAGEKSGTLVTARMASDYNRDVLVVPGSIFSPTSAGVHQFLKLGATLITNATDIIDALGILPLKESPAPRTTTYSPAETLVLSHLFEPLHRDELIRRLDLPTALATATLMEMELLGYITVSSGIYTALVPLPETTLKGHNPGLPIDSLHKS